MMKIKNKNIVPSSMFHVPSTRKSVDDISLHMAHGTWNLAQKWTSGVVTFILVVFISGSVLAGVVDIQTPEDRLLHQGFDALVHRLERGGAHVRQQQPNQTADKRHNDTFRHQLPHQPRSHGAK